MAKVAFTAGRVAGHSCPTGKAQAFLWDATAPGLGLRVTAAGAKAFIFQSEFQGNTLRTTIGSPDVWGIPQAQRKARELQGVIDQGRDPRVVKAEATAADVARRAARRNESATVEEVWMQYIAERRPHWSERHYLDHVQKAKAGGVKAKRGVAGGGLTVAGPLHAIMSIRLRDLDSQAIEAWAKKEGVTRPTAARLAWRLLKTFLTWCVEQPAYAHLVSPQNPAKTKKTREAFGKPSAKQDVLQREQLAPWFNAVESIGRPAVSAYLEMLLLTGARPGELLPLKWADINTQWKSVVIRDKVEGERIIPLTRHVEALLARLPRQNQWVFSSATVTALRRTRKTSKAKERKAGPISSPQKAHALACKAAGLDGLTLHGLRRSFASLTEWLEIPSGVVAQIMGHKPSATAEKHYKVRPLELLRQHHQKIEDWVLQQAGIALPDTAKGAGLKYVA